MNTAPALRCALAACITALLTACASAPSRNTAVPMPADFLEHRAAANAGAAGAAPRADWWTAFGDPTLDALETQLASANPTLENAMAHLQRARAEVILQRSAALPQLDVQAAAARTRTSSNIPYRAVAGHTINDFTLAVGGSWEPDLFGRIAKQVDAARADAVASAADAEAMRVSLQAELAQDYFSLRSIDEERSLLEHTIADERGLLDATQQRFGDGTASEQDVDQSNAGVEGLQAQIADLEGQRASLLHAIATLTGRTAAALELPPTAPPPQLPSIAAGVPSDLLRRRPDVAAADQRVAAANGRAGVARLAWFPSLVLSVTDGLESAALGSLIGMPSHAWSVGPSVSQPLFDGGRRRANREQAEADVDAAAADYRATVIRAINEVEDQLSAVRTLASESDHQTRAVELAKRAYQIGTIRYEAGAAAYTDVLVAQQAEITTERQALLIQRRRLIASVALIRALGGGWSATGP